MFDPRRVFTMALGIVLGNMIAERFVLQTSPDSPFGFVPVTDGFGLDEIARAACIVPAVAFVDAGMKRIWK